MDPTNIPDLRKPSAPKRLVWDDNEVSNTIVHGLLVQVAVSRQGVVTFAGGQPVNRIVRVAEEGDDAVLFEDIINGGAANISLATAKEICRTAKMSTDLWRGELDLGARTLKAWERHCEMWREAHPLAANPHIAPVDLKALRDALGKGDEP